MTIKPSHRHTLLGLLAFGLAALPAYPQAARKNRDALSAIQSVAVETLESASYELQEVADLRARAALAEDFVKLLAGRRPARCRQLLESLFGAALKQERDAEGTESTAQEASGSLVRKIIAVAAGFDPRLAQAFAERYAESKEADGDGGATGARASPVRADVYLSLAASLIEKDPALATSIAEKSLTSGVYPASEAVRQQGRKDFYTALRDVQNLKNRVARLRAIIDLCRAVISSDAPGRSAPL